MSKTKFQIAIDNIRTKIKTYQEQGNDVLYSATFITGSRREKLVDKAPVSQLFLVSKNLKCETPEKIRLDLYNGKDSTNTLWFKDIILKEPVPETQPATSFKGFGEAEINHLVDERFRERIRFTQYEQLKEQVQELTEENEELQDAVNKLELENDKLQQEVESKKQIRYYAGMLGDILESIGISKDKVKKPLAELMGINEPDSKPAIISPDNSGIVEHHEPLSPEEQKRSEIISLIAEYLKTTNNQTLTNVFNIFSEIEQDNAIANSIIQYLETLKTNNHANI